MLHIAFRFAFFLLWLAVAVLGPSQTNAQPAAVSRFTLDGKPIQPSFLSLNGTPERPLAGDLIWVDGFYLFYNGETGGDFGQRPRKTVAC